MLPNLNLFHMLPNLNLCHEMMQNLNLFLKFFETFQHAHAHTHLKSTIAKSFAILTTTSTGLRN